MDQRSTYKYELDLEKKFRKTKWLIPSISIAVSLLLITLVWICENLFTLGYWWMVFPAGLFAHSFFIVALHDASHKAITRSKADRWIMNTAAGLLILPVLGEAFRNSHLIHHANSNSDVDPLWHNDKQILYDKYRVLYMFLEFLPLLFHGYLMLRSQKTRKKRKVKSPGINYWFALYANLVSVSFFLIIKPSLWFLLALVLTLNFFSKLRHWCEHLGTNPAGSNNTFWFPLGFGVGNHDTHHYAPYVSWPVLAIGLLKRRKNSNPLYAFYGVLFKKDFNHYTEEGNVLGKKP